MSRSDKLLILQALGIFMQLINAQVAVITQNAALALVIGAVAGTFTYVLQHIGNQTDPSDGHLGLGIKVSPRTDEQKNADEADYIAKHPEVMQPTDPGPRCKRCAWVLNDEDETTWDSILGGVRHCTCPPHTAPEAIQHNQ